ncbi:MAG: alpha-L-fucosidase [Victivallaceae bacterium]|nr:alpha-L-fucosidase [Victivallaceae bacterium]
MSIPSYLKGYEEVYADNPRQAALDWFSQAGYGLFLHYGLYSLVGRHEWVQLYEKIPVSEYATLSQEFTAVNFDAEKIARFAVECGMRYINITTRHHDSFCLFKTAQTDFNSLNAPCGRDLVAELAVACEKHNLGLCLYYSHGRDWRHPHAPNNDNWGGSARPEYIPPEVTYAYGDEHNLQRYLDFMQAQITELLTQYGPVAAIWLDGVGVPLSGDSAKFHCQDLYDHIHRLQPQVLVSYKQGVTGTEDFFAPEHSLPGSDTDARLRGQISENKLIEICTTMCRGGSWGYKKNECGNHLYEEEVWSKLMAAAGSDCNLLLNSAPLPDGSLDPEDVVVLRKVGRRLRTEGIYEKYNN